MADLETNHTRPAGELVPHCPTIGNGLETLAPGYSRLRARTGIPAWMYLVAYRLGFHLGVASILFGFRVPGAHSPW